MRLSVIDGGHDILHGMGLHLFSAHGGICPAHAGEEQPQVVVNLRGGGHGAAGIANVHLLLDGNGRRNAVDGLHVRLGHAAQELPGIGRETFCKAALPLRKKGIEGKGTLSAAGHAGNHHQLAAGNLHRNVPEVVHPGMPNHYVSFCRHLFCA